MRAMVLAAILAACGGEPRAAPDPFCSGASGLEISGTALPNSCACSVSGAHLDIVFEYTLDPSGLVGWIRPFVAAKVDLPSLEGELRVWGADPLGGSSPSHFPVSFAGWIGPASACLEARVGVAGSREPAVVRMFANCEQ